MDSVLFEDYIGLIVRNHYHSKFFPCLETGLENCHSGSFEFINFCENIKGKYFLMFKLKLLLHHFDKTTFFDDSSMQQYFIKFLVKPIFRECSITPTTLMIQI